MTLTYGMLGIFMMALALAPVSMVWRDARQRARETQRLASLRHDARVQSELRRRAPARAMQWTGAGR